MQFSKRPPTRRQGVSPVIAATALSLGLLTGAAAAQSNQSLIGYDDLVERLGKEHVPTGAGIRVAQVEGLQNNSYAPNPESNQFSGKDFTFMSGPTEVSAHANSVGGTMYGNNSSIAFGLSEIWNYEAADWLQSGYLRVGSSLVPLLPPPGLRVINNSWIADLQSDAVNNEALRRADWAINQHDVLIISGVANGGNGLPLMSHLYNGLAVGKMDGGHAQAATLSGTDGPGRIKPEIVAPAGTTSSATPRVSSAAILLFETAESDARLAENPDARRPVVIKSVLLAGATHSSAHGSEWTRLPVAEGPDRGVSEHPLDPVVGAGTVNIDRSHQILTGGVHVGTAAPDAAPQIPSAGWDYQSIGTDQSRYWSFTIEEAAEELSVIVTWNRSVPISFNSYNLARYELELLRVDEQTGEPVTLIGDPGLDWFESGNVFSNSPIDNIQHLYTRNLQPGEYLIRAGRTDALALLVSRAAVAWYIDQETTQKTPPLTGDLTGDGTVGVFDLLILLDQWGLCPSTNECPADLNGSGVVDVFDLLILLENWGGAK